MKKVLAIAIAVMITVAVFAGCSAPAAESSAPADSAAPAVSESAAASDDGGTADAKDGKVYGVSVMTMNNAFFVAEVDGIKANIGPNDEVMAPDPALEIDTQIEQITDMVNAKVDVIMVDAIDSEGIKPALEEAKKAGIPVIAIDTEVADVDLVASTIVSDNTDAGRIAAQTLMDAIGGKGKIAVLDHSTVACVRERTAGLEEIMKNYPDVEIVFRKDTNGNVTEAQAATEDVLTSDPDLAGIFAINDPTASGAIAGIKGNNAKVGVVSIDGSQDAIDMIKAGDLLCTAAQFPDQIGAKAVEVAQMIFDGKTPDAKYIIPVSAINADNAAEYDGKQF